MNKELDINFIEARMQEKGLNQATLAGNLSISREAVSRWLKNESFPKPNLLLKLSKILEATFRELVVDQESEPIVAFRKKGNRKIDEKYEQEAINTGVLLKSLVAYLPFEKLETPVTLKNPSIRYEYIQDVVEKVRSDIGKNNNEKIEFEDLIDKFSSHQAVLIPAPMGHNDYLEHGIHIYLPTSMTTWIYLNLDSKVHDFKFWMSHELGHVYTPSLSSDEAEEFADLFAQTLLYPRMLAQEAYSTLKSFVNNQGKMVNFIKDEARKYIISPITIYKSICNYAENILHESMTDLLPELNIMKATSVFNKQHPNTIYDILFPEGRSDPEVYLKTLTENFKTPFFDVLREYIAEHNVAQGAINNILKMSYVDARGVYEALSCGSAENNN